ncbi:unnamed protein product [Haemonchus placei]|uniref:Family with sequence similarity 216 member B n=1 Tax=Haemonchus placei TaxID=6290 RepID=A0A0N4WBE3_HAEPC|nr:unnamed protein product [Haemonchus placei]
MRKCGKPIFPVDLYRILKICKHWNSFMEHRKKTNVQPSLSRNFYGIMFNQAFLGTSMGYTNIPTNRLFQVPQHQQMRPYMSPQGTMVTPTHQGGKSKVVV